MPRLHPPQIMKGAHAIYMVWRAADPKAAVATVPRPLRPAKNGIVFLNQYVVERADQTSSADHPAGFGAYSLTYVGVDLVGFDTKDQGEAGISPGRWWAHYINSSANMRAYMRRVGAPVLAGETTLEKSGDVLTATTLVKDRPIIRTRTKVGSTCNRIISGQFRIISKIGRRFMSGRYPAIARCADAATVMSVEFLDPKHPVYALRPKQPLEIEFCYYSPDITFAYPGGLDPIAVKGGRKRR
jgi:hypothetical protein